MSWVFISLGANLHGWLQTNSRCLFCELDVNEFQPRGWVTTVAQRCAQANERCLSADESGHSAVQLVNQSRVPVRQSRAQAPIQEHCPSRHVLGLYPKLCLNLEISFFIEIRGISAPTSSSGGKSGKLGKLFTWWTFLLKRRATYLLFFSV